MMLDPRSDVAALLAEAEEWGTTERPFTPDGGYDPEFDLRALVIRLAAALRASEQARATARATASMDKAQRQIADATVESVTRSYDALRATMDRVAGELRETVSLDPEGCFIGVGVLNQWADALAPRPDDGGTV